MKIETIKQVNIDAFQDQVSQSTIDFLRATDNDQHYLFRTTIEKFQGDNYLYFVGVGDLQDAISEDYDLKEHLQDAGKSEEEAQHIIDDIQTIIDKCNALEINRIILN